MFVRNLSFRYLAVVCLTGCILGSSLTAKAQEPSTPGTPPATPIKPEPDVKTRNQNQTPQTNKPVDPKNLTAEQIVEATILVSGGREVFNQIRRNGLERGKRSIVQNDGRMLEGIYERRFKRGETSEKDLVRLDQQTPVQYGLIYANNESWGVLNSTMFSPRAEIVRDFQDAMWHGLEPLFRYKEDGSTLRLVGREKHGGVDVNVIELTHTAKTKSDANSALVDVKLVTRYYISQKLFRVLWLEYDNGQGVKYTRRFYDYKVVQGTLVPYRSVLKRDDTVVEETTILTVTYGLKLDDTLFAKT